MLNPSVDRAARPSTREQRVVTAALGDAASAHAANRATLGAGESVAWVDGGWSWTERGQVFYVWNGATQKTTRVVCAVSWE